ncbi:glycoside hydrolase family 92 protein [Pedobacter changchengzhani]|uniref:Glycoside hydrolase family 92 protein n=1 Tax=Pedobacter changchengzhani TaxID=2529274 RepID=A0A4R5MIH8_9SPHI|nr:GH92 family glycosyl hydrolase [Pedobacter changchengzhani]TDG35156.1 glycoside hydrolase family 92 protein [Pedobacter changchengzhani]
MRINKIIITLLLFVNVSSAQSKKDYTAYVNPFIGTGGHGHTYPGPALPFGMIQPGPDTRLDGWDGCSGYHYTDSIIYGFSQTHLSGTGIEDYCDFLFMPTTGKPQFINKEYASPFQKKNEKASPGYYRTFLDKYKVNAEITTTKRAGLYRFTFPKTNQANIIIDLKHRDKVLESWVEIVNDREIKGYRKSSAWAKGQELYFHVRYNKPFKSYGIAVDDVLQTGIKKAKGKNIKLYIQFETTEQESILAQVAISAVDDLGALKNLNSERDGFNFAKTLSKAKLAWNNELAKIDAESTNKKQLTTFYTALYHSLLNPNLYMDVDGKYRGLDNKIHTAKDFEYYTVFSLWDTYRTENPLLALIDKKRTLDFIKTFLAMHQQGGLLPIWPLANEETFCMIGNHAIPVITDAYAKGIRGFDTKLALEAMKHAVNRKQFGISDYAKNGAVMADMDHDSASKTVEYAYDDWCIAQFAKMIGATEDYQTYITRAQNWKNVYDPTTQHIRARNNGGWWKPFDATEVNNNYTEGNSWHYSFSTQQDVNAHIDLMGGDKIYQSKLDELFTTKLGLTGRDQSDITGLIGQYAHGNEPSHHIAYLFNFTSHPEKTQFYINKIMNEQYHDQPDGLSGNEDCGQMSAWLVMSAMGIYPVSPGNNMYNIGTPWFKKMTVNLENGKKIVINAPAKNQSNYYIQGIKLNGKQYQKLFINYEDLANGGNLNFTLSATPDLKYLNSLQKPVMKITESLIVPNPIIDGPQETFKDKAMVNITSALPETEIYYTLDGTEPNEKSKKYAGEFEINNGLTIKAIAYKSGFKTSYVSTAIYQKITNNYTITINSDINKSFTGGGNDALIDGVRGAMNWRVGNRWQGVWGKDFEAVLDLGKLQKVNAVSIGALQDTQAWIIFPPETEFYTAGDDMNFKLVATVKSPTEANDYTIQIKELGTKINGDCRYIKIIAKNYGVLPAWHEGAGGLAHTFFDEITVK